VVLERFGARHREARSWWENVEPVGFDRLCRSRARPPREVRPGGVDYQVRTARITDVDRLVALFAPAVDPSGGPLVATDLLRQLIYLPQASVLVAERRREVIGGAILALRPSVRSGGYIGSIDLFVVDSSGDAASVTNDLLEEILRSARNKGCTVVEAARPDDPGERARWENRGFSEGGSLMTRSVVARRAPARQVRI
jgi:hypothetical protein